MLGKMLIVASFATLGMSLFVPVECSGCDRRDSEHIFQDANIVWTFVQDVNVPNDGDGSCGPVGQNPCTEVYGCYLQGTFEVTNNHATNTLYLDVAGLGIGSAVPNGGKWGPVTLGPLPMACSEASVWIVHARHGNPPAAPVLEQYCFFCDDCVIGTGG